LCYSLIIGEIKGTWPVHISGGKLIKVGIIGASGYTGAELLRLLKAHKKVEVTYVTSETYQGQKISKLYPNLRGHFDLKLSPLEVTEAKKRAELLFIALPHGESQRVVRQLFNESRVPSPELRIIDLSGDFRFKSADIYEKWYKIHHEHPELLGEAVYGLPELNREKIREARFVTNPGCYPTGAILALAPLLKKTAVFEKSIIVDSKSGVSGAGRIPGFQTHFCQVDESVKAYGVGTHKHTPEMEQELTALRGEDVMITFTPHLVPMNRGILSTCYASLKEELEEEIAGIYEDFYDDHPFVKVLGEDELPETKYVLGTNYCHLSARLDERSGRVIVISAIDNLGKGASGQAIQNMNLMLGFLEDEGLKNPGLFP